MAQPIKICPICQTRAHPAALICAVCGTSLQGIAPAKDDTRPIRPIQPRYDPRYGETDLIESEARRPRRAAVWVGVFALIATAFLGGLIVGGYTLLRGGISPNPTLTPTTTPLASPLPLIFATNTARPTIIMATVTPAPPTPLPTPTEGPCMMEVIAGDSLISVVSRCGHRDLFVLTEVLEINNLAAPELIRAGQIIEVPRPTPTPDPNAAALAPTAAPAAEGVALASFAEDATRPPPTIRPTETLLPGVTYHIVQPNQTMIEIVFMYYTEAEVLEQLNPEIDFFQCDFQFVTGGESCIVTLYAGQQIRVPAPLPTPTLSPTPSGSETPTPTATPTFNAPSAISPDDRMLFTRDELVTLRWVSSGTLGIGEAYRVEVIDLTTGVEYVADTSELTFIIPTAWQATDGARHDYQWRVSVISANDPSTLRYTTEPRIFTWQGRE